MNKLGGRVLGKGWDTEQDKISFNLSANHHDKK